MNITKFVCKKQKPKQRKLSGNWLRAHGQKRRNKYSSNCNNFLAKKKNQTKPNLNN